MFHFQTSRPNHRFTVRGSSARSALLAAVLAPLAVAFGTGSAIAARAHHSATRRAPARHAQATPSWLAPAVASTSATATPGPLGVGGSWRIKFDDEFSGTRLDRSKWQPNWLAANNTDSTPPVNPDQDLNCFSPSAVTESGGVLDLAALQRSCAADNGVTYPYTAGLINTSNSFSFTYGYMEARIYIPAAASGAPANFPAFWTDGTGNWPDTGELDVMEVLNDCGPGLGFAFHSDAGNFSSCPSGQPATGWHTFGANWQPGSVTYYYDGLQVGQLTTGITSDPMYLILDNAVDPTYGGPIAVPSSLQVDYVRVWQSS